MFQPLSSILVNLAADPPNRFEIAIFCNLTKRRDRSRAVLPGGGDSARRGFLVAEVNRLHHARHLNAGGELRRGGEAALHGERVTGAGDARQRVEIGRASCRERV